MLLEALEDSLHGPYGEGQACPRNLTVEHIMPRAWREYWGRDIEGDPVAGLNRDGLVQSLGNLTLVNGKFNSVLSNRPWTDEAAAERGLGVEGKRGYVLAHSQLSLNADLVAGHEVAWTEQDIRDRSIALVAQLAAIWPRPVTAAPVEQSVAELTETLPLEDPTSLDDHDEDPEIESHTGKYRALWRWLKDQDRDEIRLSFADVEQILAMPLPPSARIHLPHWYGYDGTALGRAIRDAGWKASQVNLTDERVVFIPGED
jgi:hypothetical protein